MKLTLARVTNRIRKVISRQADVSLDTEMVKKMAREIATARPDEIACDECFAQMDHFVDLVLEGKNAAEAMPLVQDHLDRCRDCHEEFKALLDAVRIIG